MKDPSYKDESSGRVRHFAFNWVGGGYNDVWAMNKYDAIFVANAWYGGGTANLRVAEGSVREITGKEREYHKSLPYWD
tara:strand:- start:21 stop:254 length:234 start_codon:yes stop_codon:yes gene_type:complete